MKSDRQIIIVNFLEGLVNERYSMESLNTILSALFKCEIEVYNNTQERLDSKDFDCEEDLPVDWNLMFNIDDDTEQSGCYDIYMLPMRRKGFDGADMYITEVSWEFM
jgi:hypothetical protein